MRKIVEFKCLATIAVMVMLAPLSRADSLAPGGSGVNFTNFTSSSFGALLSEQSGVFTGLDSSGNTVFTGSYTVAAYTDANTGDVDLLYQITNQNNPSLVPDAITSVSMGNFSGYATNVGYLTGSFGVFSNAGTVAPDTNGNSRTPSGSTVNFDFASNFINPGSTTDILVVATDGTNVATGHLNLQDDGNATVNALQPAPEPGSMLLLGSGLLSLATLRRRWLK